MAEIGLVASIVQIADIGCRLGIRLYAFGEIVASADHTIVSISKDISLTSSVLKELGQIFESDTGKIRSDNATRTAKDAVQECSKIFKQMDDLLLKNAPQLKEGSVDKKTGAARMLERLRWPTMKGKVELLNLSLDRMKATLTLMLNVILYAQQMATKDTPASAIAEQRHLVEILAQVKDERDKALEKAKKALAYHEIEDSKDGTRIMSQSEGPVVSLMALATNEKLPAQPASTTRSVSPSPQTSDPPGNQRSLPRPHTLRKAAQADKSKDPVRLLLNEYTRLHQTLLREVHSEYYKIPGESRGRLEKHITRAHKSEQRRIPPRLQPSGEGVDSFMSTNYLEPFTSQDGVPPTPRPEEKKPIRLGRPDRSSYAPNSRGQVSLFDTFVGHRQRSSEAYAARDLTKPDFELLDNLTLSGKKPKSLALKPLVAGYPLQTKDRNQPPEFGAILPMKARKPVLVTALRDFKRYNDEDKTEDPLDFQAGDELELLERKVVAGEQDRVRVRRKGTDKDALVPASFIYEAEVNFRDSTRDSDHERMMAEVEAAVQERNPHGSDAGELTPRGHDRNHSGAADSRLAPDSDIYMVHRGSQRGHLPKEAGPASSNASETPNPVRIVSRNQSPAVRSQPVRDLASHGSLLETNLQLDRKDDKATADLSGDKSEEILMQARRRSKRRAESVSSNDSRILSAADILSRTRERAEAASSNNEVDYRRRVGEDNEGAEDDQGVDGVDVVAKLVAEWTTIAE